MIYSLLVENLALKILEGRSPATKETFLSRIKNLSESAYSSESRRSKAARKQLNKLKASRGEKVETEEERQERYRLYKTKNLGEAYRLSKYSSPTKLGRANRGVSYTGTHGEIPTVVGNTLHPVTGEELSGSIFSALQSVRAGNLDMIDRLKTSVENNPSVVHVVKFEGQRGYGEKAKPTSFSLHVRHHQGEVKVFHKGDTSKPVELRATPLGVQVLGKGNKVPTMHGHSGELYHEDTRK